MHPTISLKHVFNLSVPCHSFLHHPSQVRLVRSGMGSCIFWGGGVSIDVSIDISIDCRSTYRSLCRSRVDRLSAECRSRVGRVSVESLSSLYRYVGDTRPLQSIGRLSVDSRPILCRRIMYLHRRVFPQEDSLSINLNSRWHIYAIASV